MKIINSFKKTINWFKKVYNTTTTEQAMVMFTFLLACFTAWLVWDGHTQLKISQKSFELAQKRDSVYIDAVHVENRAYVVVPTMDFIFDKSKTNVTMSIQIKNVGKTPAYQIRTIFVRNVINYLLSDTITPDFSKTMDTTGGVVIGGEQTISSGFDYFIKPSKIDSILTNKKFVFFYGNIIYNDVFHKSHFTHFMGKYNPINGHMIAYGNYNDAD